MRSLNLPMTMAKRRGGDWSAKDPSKTVIIITIGGTGDRRQGAGEMYSTLL